MSSRSIEGENPLYLPQAKLFDDSVGLSDTIVLARSCPRGDAMSITLTIRRQGAVVFADSTSTVHMRRSFTELRDYLFRELSFPHGVVLLTGTGIVPPVGFSLLPDDEVDISISGVGRLQHGIYRRPSNSVSMKVRDPESGSRSSESH
jgi:2-dehydro-3-deoxy-D-arabinonate dehydratase